MTIGIYSGSYDPVHIGHTMVASWIAQTGLVDRVWLLVSPLNPLKQDAAPHATAAERMEMLRIATCGDRRLHCDDIELHLPQPSYSYRTLCTLREMYPQHTFRLIVGSDNIRVFDRWKYPERILSEFGVIVYPRPGYEVTELPEGAVMADGCPVCDLSSTFIRRTIADGGDVRYYVPCNVAKYIEAHNLYR